MSKDQSQAERLQELALEGERARIAQLEAEQALRRLQLQQQAQSQ